MTRRLVAVLALLAAVALSGCAVGQSAPATNIGRSGATLNGSVFSGVDGDVAYWFEYGRTTSYGNETTHQTITIRDREWHDVSQAVTGLDAATLYHFRLCARYPGFSASCGADTTLTTNDFSQLSITARPALFPDFDPGVHDYVTRCGDAPVTMTVQAPSTTTVAIDGQAGRTGEFTQDVPLVTGQRFNFTTTTAGSTSTFHVRCLPSDFPGFSFTRDGTPNEPFYITTPQAGQTPGGDPAARYAAIFDRDGVPVWWYKSPAVDAKLQADGTLIWYTAQSDGTTTPGYEVHRLDGSLVRVWRTVGTDTDLHDFQLLANGDALMLSYPARPGTVDLSRYGGPSEGATVLDAEIQEVTPDGRAVWRWNSRDHIGLEETGARWWSALPITTLPDGRKAYDYAHINSIEQTGNTVVASFRHLDAVYAINKTTGDIIWKLGGTPRPESLPVRDDPHGDYPLGGQHYARVRADGTLTVHDNGTFLDRAPRALHYRIDLFDRSATLIEQLTDPEAPSSFCCGSAALMSDGSWLMSWGANPIVTELGPNGTRHFELKFNGGLSYRVATITASGPTIADLRSGMDAMASSQSSSVSGRLAPDRDRTRHGSSLDASRLPLPRDRGLAGAGHQP